MRDMICQRVCRGVGEMAGVERVMRLRRGYLGLVLVQMAEEAMEAEMGVAMVAEGTGEEEEEEEVMAVDVKVAFILSYLKTVHLFHYDYITNDDLQTSSTPPI